MFLNKTAPQGGPEPANYELPVELTLSVRNISIPKYNGVPYQILFTTASRPQDYFDFNAGKLDFKRSGLYFLSLSTTITQETGSATQVGTVTTYIAEGAIRYGYGGVSLHPRLELTPDFTTVINYGLYLDIAEGTSIGCYIQNFTDEGAIRLDKTGILPVTNLRLQFIS